MDYCSSGAKNAKHLVSSQLEGVGGELVAGGTDATFRGLLVVEFALLPRIESQLPSFALPPRKQPMRAGFITGLLIALAAGSVPLACLAQETQPPTADVGPSTERRFPPLKIPEGFTATIP